MMRHRNEWITSPRWAVSHYTIVGRYWKWPKYTEHSSTSVVYWFLCRERKVAADRITLCYDSYLLTWFYCKVSQTKIWQMVTEFWRKTTSHVVPLLRNEWSLLQRTSQQRLPMLLNGPDNPQWLPLPWRDLDPIWRMVPLANASQPPKRHVDRFSHLHVSRTCPTHRQTDRLTDHVTPSPSIAISRMCIVVHQD